MTAHQLAAALLAGPDLPVVVNGWGSDEGFVYEVTEVSPAGTCTFSGARDTKRTARDKMGYQLPRECLSLWHCKHTPSSDAEIRKDKADQRKARKLKRTNPKAYATMYADITPLTPAAFAAIGKP